MLMIKTLLTIWGNISALVPTHTMIATHYICLGWSLLHLLHLEVYASSFVLKVFLLRLGAFYFELVNERERERKRVMHELASIHMQTQMQTLLKCQA